MKIDFRKERSVFQKWLFSYILLIVVTLFVSCMIFFISSSIINKKILQSNINYLEQLKDTIDTQLYEAQMLALNIGLDKEVKSFMYRTENDPYVKKTLLDKLRNYHVTNLSVSDFYLYFTKSDTMFSLETVSDSETFYMTYGEEIGMAEDEWHSFLSKKWTGDFLVMQEDESEVGSSNIILAQSIPLDLSDRIMGNVVLIINVDKIMNSVNTAAQNNQSKVLISNSDSTLFSSQNIEGEQKLESGLFQEEVGSSEVKLSNKKYYLSYAKSEINDWIYVSYLPVSFFANEINRYRIMSVLILIISLIIGLCIALIYSKKNYAQITELLMLVGKGKRKIRQEAVNEYVILKNSINSLNEHAEAARKSYLLQILNGDIYESERINKIFDSFDIGYSLDEFAIVLVKPKEISLKNVDINPAQLVLLNMKIRDTIELAIQETCKGIVLMEHNAFICVLENASPINAVKEQPNDFGKMTNKIAREIYKRIYKNTNTETVISISEAHNGRQNLSAAYSQVCEEMEYMQTFASGNFISYSDMKNSIGQRYYYPLETENKIIHLLKQGSYDELEEHINKIFEINFVEYRLSITMAKCFIFNLVGTILKVNKFLNQYYGSEMADNIEDINEVLLYKSIPGTKSHLLSIMKEICRFVKNKHSENESLLNDKVKKYIIDNHTNLNLNIDMISEQLDIKPIYLAKFFKKQNSMNINQFINVTRISHSCRLLKQTETGINEIAKQVGFNNVVTFIRLFKKFHSTTPGRYRDAQILM